MGISEQPSLYQMTTQGKQWWGDPSSPDYHNEGMKIDGTAAIRRPVGSIFGESDIFILRTLLTPFLVKAGYVKNFSPQFTTDLTDIEKKIDDIFEFEKTLIHRMGLNASEFKRSTYYQYFRAVLHEKRKELEKMGTYQNMIEVLEI